MYNHFRTLLLNESYTTTTTTEGPAGAITQEFIPNSFAAIKLRPELSSIYTILFPATSQRFYKLFLTWNYLQIIRAAGLLEDLKQFDSRIVLDLDSDPSYFKFHRISSVTANASAAAFPLRVFGTYVPDVTTKNTYDVIEVTQTGAATVSIKSNVNGTFFKAIDGSTNHIVTITDKISNHIKIGSTGLSFYISAATAFNGSNDKQWSFVIEAPLVFDLNTIFTNLDNNPAIIEMLKLNPSFDTNKYEMYWWQHFNKLYRLAGLLIAFVARIDKQRQS